MDARLRIAGLGFFVLAVAGRGSAWALEMTTLAGQGPARTECVTVLRGTGTAFPGGSARAAGLACNGGEPCKVAGDVQSTPCRFSLSLCINAAEAAGKCAPSDVVRIKLKGSAGLDVGGLEAAVAALGLPSGAARCTEPVDVIVGVGGLDAHGALRAGRGKLVVRAVTSRGRIDKDEYKLVCNPGVGPTITGGGGETPTTTSTSTTTTTTLPPPPPAGVPGAGLASKILGANVSPAGFVTVRFTLTDTAGVGVLPRTDMTTNPLEARVRFTIARLEEDVQTVPGVPDFSTTFTRYVNYVKNSVGQPAYDSGGRLGTEDAGAGLFVYTFKTTLPAGFSGLTHTIGAQVERSLDGVTLATNPIFDFVPDGSTDITRHEETTTAQCNQCHNPLQAHGGNRREVRLCQLCHTPQAIDPDTGNSVDFKVMVHRIHRGKDLPSIVDGPVGSKYSIIGFGSAELVFGQRVTLCRGGRHAATTCVTDADCPGGSCVASVSTCAGGDRGGLTCASDTDCPNSTCVTAGKAVGVGFPRDLRRCETCHGAGATAAAHRERPSAAACTSCHDDMDPTVPESEGHHVAGAQPDALCRVCHKASGEEFDLSIPGSHTIPARSTALAGLRGEIVSAVGTANTSPTIRFRITDGAGTPLPSLSTMGRVAFALSGPGTDFGGASVALLSPTAAGPGSSGTLTGPDADGVYTYVLSATNKLPLDATGTWRVGMEARRSVLVNGEDVEEALANPVRDFNVDSPSKPVVARRTVVTTARCAACHGTFSVDSSIHGNLRNQVEYCVVCHNPKGSDFARRARTFCAVTCGANKVADTTAGPDDVQLIASGASCTQADSCAVAVGPNGVADTTAAGDDVQRVDAGTGAADATSASIDLKSMIHRIHSGEELEQQPYVIYGFGATPRGFTPNDFGDVRFPGNRANCESCHAAGTQLLPLPAGVLPTRTSVVALNPDASKWGTAPFLDAPTGSIPPIQDACLSCHDSEAARAHATTNTTGDGAEACEVCHGEGSLLSVSSVHAGS
ncbi:MAG: hypothetical protein U0807_12305 [Candidatus Binatia bacterium]